VRGLASIVLVGLASACAAGLVPYPSYTDASYRGQPAEGEALHALPVALAQVAIARDVEVDGPEGKEGFRRAVAGELVQAVVRSLAGRMQKPAPAAGGGAPDPTRDPQVRGGGCEARVPPRASEGGARFVLVLDSVKLEKRLPDGDATTSYEWQTGAANPEGRPNFAPKEGLGVGGDEAPAVMVSAHYLLFDHGAGKVVACGAATGVSMLKGAPTRANWDAAIADLAGHVPNPF
jgi:hypothetical protein